MDRKLFFSYIQNMQQNNQDMTGFQNSMRKNSWQKPKSLYEMNNDEQGLKAIRADLKDIAAEAHQEWLANDGTGHPRDSIGEGEANDILRDHPSWRSLSDSARDDARLDFMAHLSDIHDSHMSMLDQDEEDMRTDAFEKQNRYESYDRLSEARLRTGSPASYPGVISRGAVLGREVTAKYELGRVVARLMDPNDDIHNPENAEIKGSLLRVVNDKGVTPHLQATSASVGKISGGESFEVLGAPANDPTKTGPGKPSANVDDLRKYVQYKNRDVYRFNKPK